MCENMLHGQVLASIVSAGDLMHEIVDLAWVIALGHVMQQVLLIQSVVVREVLRGLANKTFMESVPGDGALKQMWMHNMSWGAYRYFKGKPSTHLDCSGECPGNTLLRSERDWPFGNSFFT